MRSTKLSFALILSLIFSIMLIATGCGASGNKTSANKNEETSQVKPVTLKLGHISRKGSTYDIPARDFAKELEERTKGNVKIQVFEAGQLGGEVSMAEQIQLGSLDMGVINTGALSNFVPELNIFDFPFLFRNYEHVFKSFDGEVGKSLTESMRKAGFENLGFWDFGFKFVSNSKKEIRNISDMKGLKVRVMESPVLVDLYKSLGTDPTPIPFPEVYTSIQQGVVHGFEGSYISFTQGKLQEVQSHVSELQISYGAASFLINKDTFNKLDPDTQKIMHELSEKYNKIQRQVSMDEIIKQRALVKSAGVKVVDFKEIDLAPFKNAVKSVYDKNPKYADLVAKIQAIK